MVKDPSQWLTPSGIVMLQLSVRDYSLPPSPLSTTSNTVSVGRLRAPEHVTFPSHVQLVTAVTHYSATRGSLRRRRGERSAHSHRW